MVRRFVGWVGLALVVIVAAVVAGADGFVSVVFGWVLVGYLGIRAFPGVRADFRRGRRWFEGRKGLPGRYSWASKGGDTL